MSQRSPWDEVARTYDEVRPSYPEQLMDDLVKSARLSAHSRLLEIGAGTGKATVQLAARGFQVHCVEPGRNLAHILMEKCARYPGVSVDVAAFEEWESGDARYDLILCAQAFNYLDPRIRYQKCHDLLNQDGCLALFWYGECAEMAWASDIVASGLFREPKVLEYERESTVSTETHIRIIQSTSQFIAMDDAAKSRTVEEARQDAERQGGRVNSKLKYRMYVAERTTQPLLKT